MDVCIIAAVVAMVYTLTARRKLHMEFVKLKKKKVYLQSQQEKLKSSKEDIDGIYGEKLTAFTNLQSEYQEFELEMSLPTSGNTVHEPGYGYHKRAVTQYLS